ncbi:MAG TPA: tripartite tricarboxylate transporter substrate binding protein [Burkholderiaceae bacterium]|nr:tripartite tricarboxylate transporter substrate binding protein [Burkholderiaceae bacterium]
MLKRTFLAACVAATATFAAGVSPAHAQSNWPQKPIRLIVPYPPGGPVDSLGRAIAPALGKELGQPIVIDNKAGASGTIGMAAAMKAEPDGYTFGFGVPGAITVLPHLQKLPYSVDEIQYVSLVARVPQVIVASPKAAIGSLQDVIAKAKEQPGKLNYGSAGNATTPHLGAELFAQEAGVKLTHVPYKGAAPVLTALLGGEIEIAALDLSAVLPFVSQGVKILAVSGPSRVPVLPNVATTSELGLPKVQSESAYGIIAATGTPPAIVQKFRDALVKVLDSKDVKDRIAAQGAIAQSSTPEAYKKMMQADSIKWATVLKKGNITLD